MKLVCTGRPYPDKSKEYQEHGRHIGKCKWCQWDREQLLNLIYGLGNFCIKMKIEIEKTNKKD